MQCSVSDVVAKDIVPQNAYPGCQMGVAERERDTKKDFYAISVAVMGIKPEIVTLHHAITIRELPRMNSEKETQLLELKPEGQMEVMKSGVCLDVDAKDKLLLVNGKVGERCVEVLRDTGCTGVPIKRDLVNQGELTGEKGYVTTFDKTLLIKAPIAKIQVDASYYVGEVEALCVQEPVADLIIGNITGAREADNSDTEWKLAAAAITWARARQGDNVKALNVKQISSRFSVSRKELCKLQSEDDELKTFSEKKDLTKHGEFEVKFETRQGILYQIRRRIDGLGECGSKSRFLKAFGFVLWKSPMIPYLADIWG